MQLRVMKYPFFIFLGVAAMAYMAAKEAWIPLIGESCLLVTAEFVLRWIDHKYS